MHDTRTIILVVTRPGHEVLLWEQDEEEKIVVKRRAFSTCFFLASFCSKCGTICSDSAGTPTITPSTCRSPAMEKRIIILLQEHLPPPRARAAGLQKNPRRPPTGLSRSVHLCGPDKHVIYIVGRELYFVEVEKVWSVSARVRSVSTSQAVADKGHWDLLSNTAWDVEWQQAAPVECSNELGRVGFPNEFPSLDVKGATLVTTVVGVRILTSECQVSCESQRAGVPFPHNTPSRGCDSHHVRSSIFRSPSSTFLSRSSTRPSGSTPRRTR